MHDEIELIIPAAMHDLIYQLDITKFMLAKAAEELVMVARKINDLCIFPGFPHQFLDDIIVRLRPIEILAHGPTIYYITHEI